MALDVGTADRGPRSIREPLRYNLPGHGAAVADLDWTATAHGSCRWGFDGTVRVYAMHSEELLDLGRARATRTLTNQECRQYLDRPDS